MRIYVASSWRNYLQPIVVTELRMAGHQVYDFKNPSETDKGFSWSEIDPNWQDWSNEEYITALQHPIAQKGFDSDFNAMKRADVCVLVMPCGRSAHVEAGWMQGAGKPTIVLIPSEAEPELMYKIFENVCTSIAQLKHRLSNLQNQLQSIYDTGTRKGTPGDGAIK